MDFFNLKDSKSWDDSTDSKLLHSNLFQAPTSPNKSKKGKKQIQHKDARPKPGKLVSHGQMEDVNTNAATSVKKNPSLFEVAEDQGDSPPKPPKKKRTRTNSQGSVGSTGDVARKKFWMGKHKRTRTNSQGSVSSIDNVGAKHKRTRTNSQGSISSIDNFGSPLGQHKRIRTNSQGSVGSIDDIAQDNVKQLYHKHVEGVESEDLQEPLQKKKRKRKARKNKFKDEEGHLKEQYNKSGTANNHEQYNKSGTANNQKYSPSKTAVTQLESDSAISKNKGSASGIVSAKNETKSGQFKKEKRSKKQTMAKEQNRNSDTPNKQTSLSSNTEIKVPQRSDFASLKSSADRTSERIEKISDKSPNGQPSSKQQPTITRKIAKSIKSQNNNEHDEKKKRKRLPQKRRRQNSETTGKKLPTQISQPDNVRKASRRGLKRQNNETGSQDMPLANDETAEYERSLKEVNGSEGLLHKVTVSNKHKAANNEPKPTGLEPSHTDEKITDKAGARGTHSESRRSGKLKKAKTVPSEYTTELIGKDELSQADASKKSIGTSSMKSRLENQLRGSHFRFINEKFYLCTGDEAFQMMSEDREAFKVYHEGYSQQVQQWPVNPVDVMIKYLQSQPASLLVGDFGCGEAKIAETVKQAVHSFDLSALNKRVTVCDMTEVPLADNSLDVAVYCLSLMGTNWVSYLKEANRLLKPEGTLKIAEVASRFQSLAGFLKIMKSLGFQSTSKDLSNKMFYLFDFIKKKPARHIDENKGEILKPCLYKKR